MEKLIEALALFGVVGLLFGLAYVFAVWEERRCKRHLCTCKDSKQPSADGYCSWCHSGFYGI